MPMTHQAEMWDCILRNLPKRRWVALHEIYSLIEHSLDIDTEDYAGQSPNSGIPKWKRNVRNVLQYRKGTDEIEWDERGSYRL